MRPAKEFKFLALCTQTTHGNAHDSGSARSAEADRGSTTPEVARDDTGQAAQSAPPRVAAARVPAPRPRVHRAGAAHRHGGGASEHRRGRGP